ncbi:MAG: hypothetical protein JXB04_00485 [Kiritimatiellae bacterium]|nr:hypothetical protein [Kiritimatiellia bacterium]
MKMFLPVVLAAVVLLCAAPPAIPAAERLYQAGPEAAFRQLERDIPALYLLNGLFLTPAQNDRLAALLEQMQKLETGAGQELARLESKYGGTFGKAAGRAASGRPADDNRMNEARQELRSVHQETRRKLDDLARKAWDLMAPAQHEILYTFQPCFIPAADFKNPVRVGQAQEDTEFGEKVLARLRIVRDDRVEEAKKLALERIVPYLMQKSHMKYSEQAEQKLYDETRRRLDAALPKVRDLSDVDYELEKADLVRQVMPLEKNVLPLAEDYTAALWKTSAYVLNAGCLDVVRARGTRPPPARGVPAYVSGELDALKTQRDRLQAGLLLNRLALTPNQVRQVLPVIRAGAEAARTVEHEAERTKREAIFAYEDLRKELAAGAPTPETEQNANHFHATVKKLYEDDLVKAVRPHENELDTLLAAEQVAALIEHGKGPPPEGAPPAGAAVNDRRLAMQTLQRAVKMSAVEFDKTKQHIAGVFVASCLGHGPDGSGVDVAAETARAVGVLEKARGMGRRAAADQRLELAVELCPRRMTARPTPYGTVYDRGEPLPVLEQTSRLLFTPAAIEMLERMNAP